jgi:hypothetical protein
MIGTGQPNDHGFDLFYGYLDQIHAHHYYPSYLVKNRNVVELNNPKIHKKHNVSVKEINNPASYSAYQGKKLQPVANLNSAG